MNAYQEFLKRKEIVSSPCGIEAGPLNQNLFDFQEDLVRWALKRGRAALFCDCGLGKTLMELAWAESVCRRTNKNVLILTPLAVSHQHITEAEKFGIEAHRINGSLHKGINIVNYERLHHVDPASFSGIVCDESSIFKSFDGSTRKAATEFMRKIPYRLMATATAAPNDYIELGTTSEALGELGYVDMLNRFFKNDNNNSGTRRHFGEAPKWRFKGHAELPFWRWICSWARAIRKPSDIGFKDDRFILPPLIEQEHILKAEVPNPELLFALPAVGLKEQRAERRRTIDQRCEKVAKIVKGKDQSLVWCHLNDEGDLLQKIIPNAVQVSGQNSDEEKEEAFIGFAKGQIQCMVIKPKIGAHGLNFQNCHHVTFFPSHSWEQYYQGVRRCWRFGQKNTVIVDIVSTEGEIGVLKNLQRKAAQADRMFTSLVEEMNRGINVPRGTYGNEKEKIPSWL